MAQIGMNRAESMYANQEMNLTLYRKQSKDQLDRRVWNKSHAYEKINKSTLKAHVTTTERTDITYQSK